MSYPKLDYYEWAMKTALSSFNQCVCGICVSLLKQKIGEVGMPSWVPESFYEQPIVKLAGWGPDDVFKANSMSVVSPWQGVWPAPLPHFEASISTSKLPENCKVCNYHNPWVGKEHLQEDGTYICRSCPKPKKPPVPEKRISSEMLMGEVPAMALSKSISDQIIDFMYGRKP